MEHRREGHHGLSSREDTSLKDEKSKLRQWDDPARYFVEGLQEEKQKYRAPPNRFDIPPGKYWDGVDRSNGFEKRLFQERASKVSIQERVTRHDYEDL